MQADTVFVCHHRLDIARFERKVWARQLAEIDNAIYRLATNIRRTLKRTNALKNIMIPKFEDIALHNNKCA